MIEVSNSAKQHANNSGKSTRLISKKNCSGTVKRLHSRFNYCRCVVAINAKAIYRFEVRVLKRFFCKAWVRGDFVIRDFCRPLKETISGKGHFIDDSNEYKFIYVPS